MQLSVQETNSWELFIPRFLKVSTARPQVDWAELSSAKDVEWEEFGCTFLIGTVPATRFVSSNLGTWAAVAVAGWTVASLAVASLTVDRGSCPPWRGKPAALTALLSILECTRTRDQGLSPVYRRAYAV